MPSSTELENLRASKRFITKCGCRVFFFFFASKTWKHVTFSILQWKVVLRSPCYYDQSFLSRRNARRFSGEHPVNGNWSGHPLIRPSATFFIIHYSVNTATHIPVMSIFLLLILFILTAVSFLLKKVFKTCNCGIFVKTSLGNVQSWNYVILIRFFVSCFFMFFFFVFLCLLAGLCSSSPATSLTSLTGLSMTGWTRWSSLVCHPSRNGSD